MNIKVNQEFDQDYYREFYAEWLKFRSKYRKWEVKLGIMLIGFGLINYLFLIGPKYFTHGLLLWGVWSLFDYHFTKKNWLKERLKSNMINHKIFMEFDDDKIHSNGPNTITTSSWNFIKDAIETDKGLFLIPENGVSIYLQKKSFTNAIEIKEIVKKVKGNERNVRFDLD